jgi:anhydro-N-acetylmuramic acid kinase
MSEAAGLKTAIGVISGTSMDGIDVALIRSNADARVEPGPGATFDYPSEVGRALREVIANPEKARAPLADLERAVTDAHVDAVRSFLVKFAIDRREIALVGLHGQTILHRPKERFTRQLCDGARAAKCLGVDVVNDFRAADVAAGGEGAPLAPLYHAAIAAGLERPLMLLNWGGVGNITYLARDGAIAAFDTGPANALIDDFLSRRRGVSFDEGGALAASGSVDRAMVDAFLKDPYFALPPPKSLDRNHFHALAHVVDALSDADGAATLAAFTIEATVASVRHFKEAPARWLVCGGGRRNLALMRALEQRLSVKVEPIEAIGYDGDVIEAQCFAYLALRSRRGWPLSLPTTTRAPAPLTGGVYWPAMQ